MSEPVHPKGKNNPKGLRDIPFALPEVTRAEKNRARKIADALDEHYSDAFCELTHSSAHELLIATILSAQSTDAGVNKATPNLFKAYPRRGTTPTPPPRRSSPTSRPSACSAARPGASTNP